jgi:hypothetical protein
MLVSGRVSLRRAHASPPVFRKRDGRPDRLVVVRGHWWLVEARREGHTHEIQQSVEFNFVDRALKVRGDNDRAHRNLPQNYPRAITGFDYVLFIAATGRETGTFSTKLWLKWSAPAFHSPLVHFSENKNGGQACSARQGPVMVGTGAWSIAEADAPSAGRDGSPDPGGDAGRASSRTDSLEVKTISRMQASQARSRADACRATSSATGRHDEEPASSQNFRAGTITIAGSDMHLVKQSRRERRGRPSAGRKGRPSADRKFWIVIDSRRGQYKAPMTVGHDDWEAATAHQFTLFVGQRALIFMDRAHLDLPSE